ncbi:hypothetical protein [Vibrio mediterranei]|uniref:Uncharacterized protein n=1 Tax=Vibrio mediterranei TaxID=689 RepID=A0AAN1FMJ8_9VIBR|nr:hypothetical protein [Vibrio mediterranei]ASI93407.1 hypothetical protein BSZ05_26515 [Vibrio mediterranei]
MKLLHLIPNNDIDGTYTTKPINESEDFKALKQKGYNYVLDSAELANKYSWRTMRPIIEERLSPTVCDSFLNLTKGQKLKIKLDQPIR